MNMGLMIYNSFLEWMITLQFYDYKSNLIAILCFWVPCSDQGQLTTVQALFGASSVRLKKSESILGHLQKNL